MPFIKLLLLFFLQIPWGCHCHDKWKQSILELQNKGKELYSTVNKSGAKDWQYQVEDRLTYPRGDKWKLKEIWTQWLTYYDCLVRTAERQRDKKSLTAYSLMTYVGMTLTINCTICLSPDGTAMYEWWFSEDIERPSFSPLDLKETMLIREGTLIIYGVTRDDGGLYLCRLGATNGSRVYVEIVDEEEKYIVATQELQPAARISDSGVLVWSRTGAWSDCSSCGRVGRRRRIAMCSVKLPKRKTSISDEDDLAPQRSDYIDISEATLTLLKAFPRGIPCRSNLLPRYLKDQMIIRERPSEIMIHLCKVRCNENVIFEVRSKDGNIIEQANNSAGIYSLLQSPPAQPPPPARDILFLNRLDAIRILCPGSLFTDTPYKWRIGSLEVVPRLVEKESNGRIYISARDQLVITSLRLTDSNVYSCWQRGRLAGVVKLIVSDGNMLHYNRHLTLLSLTVVAAVAFRMCLGVLRNKRSKIVMR